MMDRLNSQTTVIITGKDLTIKSVVNVSRKNAKSILTPDIEIRRKILQSQKIVCDIVKSKSYAYGINTGFGGKLIC
jgi:histidine ammonia-lyase